MEALRVQHLAGYGLEVPDVAVARDFYTAFGLAPDMHGETLQLRSAQSGPADIVILKAAQKRLHHLSFAINDGDLERFSERLAAAGCPAVTPPFGAVRDGLWFQDPGGTWINLVPVEAK
ncbi:MAG: VOC family protein, partial [Croceibacterium sp.]